MLNCTLPPLHTQFIYCMPFCMINTMVYRANVTLYIFLLYTMYILCDSTEDQYNTSRGAIRERGGGGIAPLAETSPAEISPPPAGIDISIILC